MIDKALHGGRGYKTLVAVLVALIIVGAVFYLRQLSYGLGLTGMSRDVSWGLYICNLTFFVGVAASAVMVVLPYYLHDFKAFAKITAFGEFLAVAAVIVAGTSVTVDLGQPGRIFNLLLHPTPNSPLFWDVVCLSGYLLLNIVIGWTVLACEHKDEPPPRWVKPLIIISIPWAVSIHTVTAFIYSGLAARPMWLSALMAPKFLSGAFASGPALLILLLLVMRKTVNFDAGEKAIGKLRQIITYSLIITLFFTAMEMFTVFFSQVPGDVEHFKYLLFGLDGAYNLVPWMWSSIALAVGALLLLLTGATHRSEGALAIACGAIFVSLWIEKGLGLITPAFIPSQTGVVFQYTPTVPEILIALGVCAIGALVLTVLYKITISVHEEIAE